MSKKGTMYILALGAFWLTIILSATPYAAAQGVAVLGEIRAEGRVLVGSSGGQWTSVTPGYPLLQATSLRTEDGVASIYFKDGSRIALSKDTAAIFEGSAGDYSVSLSKGVMAFNIGPAASLSVTTSSGSISTRNRNNIVQKVSYEKAGRVKGIISTSEKGTEVRSVSGSLQVNINASDTKLVSAGESVFIGGPTVFKAQAVQAVVDDPEGSDPEGRRRGLLGLVGGGYESGGATALTLGILGAGVTGMVIAAIAANNKHSTASPSTP